MSRTGRAVWFTGDGGVAVREEAVEPKDGELVIESRISAISHGTERRILFGHLSAALTGETLSALQNASGYPVKYGYMNAGTARDGARYFAFYPHQDVFAAAESSLLPVGDELEFDDAVLLANVETALGVVHDAAARYGETVCVAGQGVVGLLVSELLVECGAAVLAVEPNAARRRRSEENGCVAIDPNDDMARERIFDATEGRGTDVGINLTGSADALQHLIDTAGHEARIVEASWYGTSAACLDLGMSFHRKRLQVVSSQVSHLGAGMTSRWSKNRRLELAKRVATRIRPSKYITHRFPLDHAEAAFALLASDDESVLQIVLEP